MHPPQLWNVKSSMHGRNRSGREVDSQRIVQNVNVKVQDVKPRGHLANFVEHNEMIRNGVCNVGIKTKGVLTASFKSSGGN